MFKSSGLRHHTWLLASLAYERWIFRESLHLMLFCVCVLDVMQLRSWLSPLLCGFWESNSSRQAWWQAFYPVSHLIDPTLLFWGRLMLNLEFISWARLPSQQGPGICLSPMSNVWVTGICLNSWIFIWVLGPKHLSLCLHGSLYTEPSPQCPVLSPPFLGYIFNTYFRNGWIHWNVRWSINILDRL